MKLTLTSILFFLLISITAISQTPASLVPDKVSNAPDYFCTWNVQGYICSYGSSSVDLRKAMNEQSLLGTGQYQNWVNFFPKIRKDLIFVMDDSWDVPQNDNSKTGTSLGLVELSPDRFPSFTGTPTERLKRLVNVFEIKGWKGLGGWICAQEAPIAGTVDQTAYWTERLKAANDAGFDYWKVDWGKQQDNEAWRKMLTQLGRTLAPKLVVEHAMTESNITFSDTYRTYDVENIIAQPTTIQRIANMLKYTPTGDARSIINCEDEPYIAAGLGCAIGVMRHPFVGNLPNGTADFAFPDVGCKIKRRLDEVARGIRWHRIAEPFGVGSADYKIDGTKLEDYWVLGDRETWKTSRNVGDIVKASAPARVSRGLPLPTVVNSTTSSPFILSSKYPNGAVAIVTIGRALKHQYVTDRVKIEQNIESLNNPIGIFGDYDMLTLILPTSIKASDYKVFGQDLAGDSPVDITNDITIANNKVIIPGDLIRKVGLSAATLGDLSDPGLVIKFVLQTPSATNDISDNSKLNVYPNPTMGKVTIDGLQAATDVSINSINGQEVLRVETSGSVDLSELERGIYFLNVGKLNKMTLKVLKN
jgi:hypothetical protein